MELRVKVYSIVDDKTHRERERESRFTKLSSSLELRPKVDPMGSMLFLEKEP